MLKNWNKNCSICGKHFTENERCICSCHNVNGCEHNPIMVCDICQPIRGTVIVEVEGGVVQDVRNLPKGYDWKLIDHDVEKENDDPVIDQCTNCKTDLTGNDIYGNNKCPKCNIKLIK